MAVNSTIAVSKRHCLHCGAHVSRDFRRVYGDSDDLAHRCRECDSFVRLSEGSAAGLEVGTNDPETSPGRHGDYHGRRLR